MAGGRSIKCALSSVILSSLLFSFLPSELSRGGASFHLALHPIAQLSFRALQIAGVPHMMVGGKQRESEIWLRRQAALEGTDIFKLD